MPGKSGKLIVLEGMDGAGKSTQTEWLTRYYTRQGREVATLHFPVMTGGYGKLVAEFLRGDLGPIDQVHPKLTALLFAGDRMEHIDTLKTWLAQGKIIILDRYVYSNIAYQCAKCTTPEQAEALQQWILHFEYTYIGLPVPNHNFYLDVPLKAVERALTKERTGDDRAYLEGKEDIHEASLTFQQQVAQLYLKLTQQQADFTTIPCYGANGELLTPEAIHQKITALLAD